MKNNNVRLLSLFRDINNTVGYASLMSIIYIYLCYVFRWGHEPEFIGVAFVVATTFVDYFLRAKCKNIMLFILFHILMVPGAIALPLSISATIVLCIYLVILFFMAMKFWISEDTDRSKCTVSVTVEILILILPLYLHAFYMMSNAVSVFILYAALLFGITYYIGMFLEQLLTYVLSIPSGSSIPLKKIMTSSTMMFGGIFAGAIAIFEIFSFTFHGDEGFGAFVREIARVVIGFFDAFFKFFERFKQPVPEAVPAESTTEAAPSLEAQMLSRMDTNNTLETAYTIAKFIILILFIAAIIYVFVQFIRSHFNKNTRETDIIEKSSAKTVNDKIIHETSERKSFFHFKDNRDKIRKLYKKKILTYQAAVEITELDTPNALREKIQKKTSENHEELTMIYEQARYGKDMPDNHMVTRIKQLTK